MQGPTGARPGRRMVSLGRVTAPKPVNLPSQKRENNGLDPNVTLVPKSSSVWGDLKSGQGDGAPLPVPQAPVQAPQPSPPAQFGSAWGGAGMTEKRQVSALLKQDEFPTLGASPSDGLPNGGPYNDGHGYSYPPQGPVHQAPPQGPPTERSPWDAPPPAPYGKPGPPGPGNFQAWGGPPPERWGNGPPPTGPGGYGPPPPGQFHMEGPPGPRYMPHPGPGFMDYPPPPPPPPPRTRPPNADMHVEPARGPAPKAPAAQTFTQPPGYGAADRNVAGGGYLPPHLRNRDRRDVEGYLEPHADTSTPRPNPEAPSQQTNEWGSMPAPTQPSLHTSLPQPSPPKILRREPVSPSAAPEHPMQPQVSPPQLPHQHPLPHQHAPHTAMRPQHPPQHTQRQQQQMEAYAPRPQHVGTSQHLPPEQPRVTAQGPLQFGQLVSPSGQAKQILGHHLQGSYHQQQQQQLPNGQHPLHPIQQRPHSGQGFSPKVQQQLGFSPSPSAAGEPVSHEPLMTFGQAGQGGPTGRPQESVAGEHRDAARELEAQQAFMRQKALQRHQEAMAHQQQLQLQQQERPRRDSEASRRSLPQSSHSHQSQQQESDREAGFDGGFDPRSVGSRDRGAGASRGRGRDGGRGRGAREDRTGADAHFGEAHPPPQTAAIPPSEQLIMQAKMRALTLGANQTSSQGLPPPSQHQQVPPQPPQRVPPQQMPPQQQQQQQQRRQPHPERSAAPQRQAPRAEPIREAQPKAVPVQRLLGDDLPPRRPVTAHDRPERAQAVPAEALPQRERPRRDKRGRHAEATGEGHGEAVAVAIPVEAARHDVAARGSGEQRGGKSAAGHNQQVEASHGAGGGRGPRTERRPRPPRGDRPDQQQQQHQGGKTGEQQEDRTMVLVQGGHRLENGDVRERPPRPARADQGPRAPRREQGDTQGVRGMNGVHEEGMPGTGGDFKKRSRGERAAKKARAVGSEDRSGISAPPGLTAVPAGSSNSAAKKHDRAERELYHPPVKEPTASEAEEAGEVVGQATNGKPPGLKPRRPRGGRDRRAGRDRAPEESTDGTGDGQEAADGGGETGQEQKSRRSRGRGRGQGGKGNKGDGDGATPEAVSETTSNKADDGDGAGEGEVGQGKGTRASRSSRGRGSRGGTGRGRRTKDGDAATPTAVPITTPGNGGPAGTERPASAAASGEDGKPKTLEVARVAVDSKGKRVWTVKDGSSDAAAGQPSSKVDGASIAGAASSGAPE